MSMCTEEEKHNSGIFLIPVRPAYQSEDQLKRPWISAALMYTVEPHKKQSTLMKVASSWEHCSVVGVHSDRIRPQTTSEPTSCPAHFWITFSQNYDCDTHIKKWFVQDQQVDSCRELKWEETGQKSEKSIFLGLQSQEYRFNPQTVNSS